MTKPPVSVASVSSLTELLRDADPAQRRRAAEALGAEGRRAAEAVNALEALVRDPDQGVRVAAVRALGRVGLAASSATPTLVDVLRDSSLRDEALTALQKLDLRTGLRPLAQHAAATNDLGLRDAVATLLRRHAPEAVPLILEETIAGREESAAATISTIGTQVFPLVVEHLVDPAVAPRAARILRLGDPDMAVAALIDALNATAPESREAARALLREHGVHWVRPALRALQTAGRSPTRREDTFSAIGVGSALPIIVEELASPDPATRAQAAYAIGAFGPLAASAVPALMEAILRGEGAALGALRTMGPHASRAAPVLARAVLDPRLTLRALDTTLALGPGVVAAVASDAVSGAGNADRTVRETTRRLLSGLGPDHAAATPSLTAALSHESPDVRAAAARALGRIGPRAIAATPHLLELLSDPAVGAMAGVALVDMAVAQASAGAPALLGGVARGDRDDRLACFGALQKLGARANPDVTVVARQLDDGDPAIRAAAVRLLALLGARTVLPELEAAGHDPDPLVRRTAQETVSRLSSDAPIGRAGAGWQLAEAQGAGAVIASVASNGPAARAGLQAQDKIVRVGDELVESPRDLLRRLAAARPGDMLKLHILRGGEAQVAQLELETR